MTLYHYTCDHGHDRINDMLKPHIGLVWLTDLEIPHVSALGLTSVLISCDRTQHRYRVTDEADCVPWITYRMKFQHDAFGRERLANLEIGGALPRHWWVSESPIPVVYDPVRRAV